MASVTQKLAFLVKLATPLSPIALTFVLLSRTRAGEAAGDGGAVINFADSNPIDFNPMLDVLKFGITGHYGYDCHISNPFVFSYLQ
jgi:hypothetical protein